MPAFLYRVKLGNIYKELDNMDKVMIAKTWADAIKENIAVMDRMKKEKSDEKSIQVKKGIE